jgi:hypothetical protein
MAAWRAFQAFALAGLDEAPLPVDAARNAFACSPQIIMTDFFEELQRLVRYLLLGHDGNRVDFHEEIRIRQACDEEHGDRRRVGPVSPRRAGMPQSQAGLTGLARCTRST